jgi:hypothetical protein
MKDTINKQNALSTPTVGGRGAYVAPRIEWIPLDNEISLALQSSPPDGPDETMNYNIEPDINNPFKSKTV